MPASLHASLTLLSAGKAMERQVGSNYMKAKYYRFDCAFFPECKWYIVGNSIKFGDKVYQAHFIKEHYKEPTIHIWDNVVKVENIKVKLNANKAKEK